MHVSLMILKFALSEDEHLKTRTIKCGKYCWDDYMLRIFGFNYKADE